MSLCDRDMRIASYPNEYGFYEKVLKRLRPVTMLKKRLYLRHFLAGFVNFCVATAFETFCELFYKYLDECF